MTALHLQTKRPSQADQLDSDIAMTADQYRAALKKLGLTQLAAGDLFRVGPRTSRRWALDEARVPDAVAMLLALMLKKRIKPEELARLKLE